MQNPFLDITKQFFPKAFMRPRTEPLPPTSSPNFVAACVAAIKYDCELIEYLSPMKGENG